MLEAAEWSNEMFGECELGDARLTTRLVDLARRLALKAGASIVKCCNGDSAAQLGCYRFLRNDRVSDDAIAEGGFAAVARRAQRAPLLLAVEDTTTLSYSHGVGQQLGPIGNDRHSTVGGYLAHSVLLLDAERESTVGLIEQTLWQRAYADKESYQWQHASQRVAQRLGSTLADTIAVCDRESDVYEYLAYKQAQAQRFIVRASLDRRIEQGQYLFRWLDTQAPVIGTQTVSIAQRGGRPARCARMVLRATTLTLLPPRQRRQAGPPLSINAVVAQEIDAPPGVKPLCWRLLTREPIDTLAQVIAVVRYYALRWRIEEYHKAWKSGVGVERQRMQHANHLKRMIVVTAFVAVRLLPLREGLDPQVSDVDNRCDAVLEQDEWHVLWKAREQATLPDQPPTLSWAYRAVAGLGGFTDTKRTGRAGWETLWRGWSRLQDLLDGYRLFNQHAPE